jgi:hypothetical protein
LLHKGLKILKEVRTEGEEVEKKSNVYGEGIEKDRYQVVYLREERVQKPKDRNN